MAARERSSVGIKLALRPESCVQALMPLTARVRATRREVWVTGFDCGVAAVLLRALPHPARWSSPGLIERAWVLARLLASAADRGNGKA
jgi:hypothetical protein